jgi:hypothetical protein
MTAVLKIYAAYAGTDGSPTAADTAAVVRLKTADDITIDTVNPCIIPAAGTNYSFWKTLNVYCSTAPNTQVDNLKIYTAGSDFGTGFTTSIGDQYPNHTHASTSGYKVATGTIGTTGTELLTGYTGITSKTGLFTYTSGSPVALTISETSNIIVNIGDTSNYFVIQVALGTTATPGTKAAATITVQYDEI